MKDLLTLKNSANIIPITKKLKQNTPSVISAFNSMLDKLPFPMAVSKGELISYHTYILNLLDAKIEDSVFLVGQENLINAAVLAKMGAKVTFLADDKYAILSALEHIKDESTQNIEVISKQQLQLIATMAPFARILVAPEASNLPVELYALLAIGGQMVVCTTENDTATFLQILRNDTNDFDVKKKNGLEDRTASYEVFDL